MISWNSVFIHESIHESICVSIGGVVLEKDVKPFGGFVKCEYSADENTLKNLTDLKVDITGWVLEVITILLVGSWLFKIIEAQERKKQRRENG